jgi:hypothetical protein
MLSANEIKVQLQILGLTPNYNTLGWVSIFASILHSLPFTR